MPANQKGAIPARDSPSFSLWLSKQEVYRLLLSRSPAYPARPTRPLPSNATVPGSGTNSGVHSTWSNMNSAESTTGTQDPDRR